MTLGLGAYAGAQPAPVVQTGVKLVLCHLNASVASAVRTANPHALIGLRADLGDDGQQVNFAGDAAAEAIRFYNDRIITGLAKVPSSTYSFAVGINERWPAKGDLVGLRWRATFEITLCRRLQNELGMPYAWGAIPVGNLEASEVDLFADLFREAWATNYHGYLGPGRTTLAEETDAYYSYRPIGLWLPDLQKLKIPLRLLLGECGTFAPPTTYPNFDVGKEAALAVAITRQYEQVTQLTGFTFVGACAFGIGTVGKMAPWDLSAALDVFREAAKADAQPAPIQLPGGSPMPPTYSSPNHDGPRALTLGVVLHATLGGSANPVTEYNATLNWFDSQASQVSAHAVVGPGGMVAYPVDPSLIAWHCRASNATWLGIEMCKAHVADAILPEIVDRAAQIVAGWCKEYAIPMVWSTAHGLAEHREMPTNTDGHQDVGGPFDRAAFLAAVQKYGGEVVTPEQKKAILDDCDFLWAYSTAAEIAKNPAESERVIHERIVALKVTLGINT